MKVKINGKIYDANNDVILLHLNDHDKLNINNMSKDASIYGCFPNDFPDDKARGECIKFKEEASV